MIIQVTKDDINQGKQEDCHFCPVALAIRRVYPFSEDYKLFGERNYVSVSTRTVYIGAHRYYLPSEAKQFIRDFDDRMETEPFEFNLNEIEDEY